MMELKEENGLNLKIMILINIFMMIFMKMR